MSSADSLAIYPGSAPAAGVATGLFGLLALLHLICYFAYRSWYFHCMLKGTIFEVISFGVRLYFIKNDVVGGILASDLTSILIPSIMAITCFMTFDRIVWYTTTPEQREFQHLWAPARYITSLFVVFDLLAFAIILLGARQISHSATLNSDETFDAGVSTLRAGLVIQLICFGSFGVVSTRFQLISRNWDVPGDQFSGKWKQLLIIVNVAVALFILRIVYRLVQFAVVGTPQGLYLASHEWVFYALDTTPVFVICVLFIMVHPGRSLPKEFIHFRLGHKKLKNDPEPELVAQAGAF